MNVILDLLPAKVQTPTVFYEKVRLTLTDEIALIYGVENSKAVCLRSEHLSAYEAPTRANGAKHTITLESGEVWTAVRAGGCACNSPLRRLQIRKILSEEYSKNA